MSSDRLNVRVVSNQNSVELIKNENIVFVTDKKQDTSVNVTQKETAVVTVASKGPKGDKGDKGDTGNAGTVITNQITTGSITASVNIGTNTFSVQSGSSTFLFVSSSGNVGINTITPRNTLEINGGITSISITSSLLGTASMAVNAQTASFLPVGTYNITSSWAQSASNVVNAQTASFLSGAFLQNGNSFGAAAVLGTNDNQNLHFETNGSVRMTISSSGNVGIGTTTPTTTLNVSGTTLLQGGQTTVQGSGATSATTALRVENSSAAARLTILDDGTSAFNTNHLYVSGGGFVGIGTTLPTAELHISGANTDNLFRVSSPSATNALFVSGSGRVGVGTTTPNSTLDVNGNTIVTGSITNTSTITTLGSIVTPSQTIAVGNGFGNSSGTTNLLNIAGNLVPTATAIINSLAITSTVSQSVNPTTIIRGILVSPTFNTLGPQYRGFEWNNNQGFGLYGVGAAPNYLSGSLGIGTTTPSASLHISGANTDNLFRVSSPSATNALFVSGSGRVGVGTTTPRELLHVAGGNIALDGTRHIDFGSGNSRIIDLGLTAGQGYPITISTFGPIGTGTANNLTEKLRLTGSGSLGLGTNSPSARFHISGGFTDGNLMRVQSPTGAEYFFISASGNVGIGTSVPNAKLHISSNSGYQLRVAASASFSSSLMVSGSFGYVGIGVESPQSILHVNGRPEFNNVTGNVPTAFAGNYQNITTFYNNNNQDNTVLGEPTAWMNIKCDGAEYLIPLYTS